MHKSNKDVKKQKSKNTGEARRFGSVQQTFCPIVAVEHEAIACHSAGRLEWLAVLEVEGLSGALCSEEEQYRLNEQFQQCLIALAHPLQILIRVVPIDLERYLSSFTSQPEARAAADRLTETWMTLASSHVAFMKNRAARTPLLERRFYLVIPGLSDSVQEGAESTFTHLFRQRTREKQGSVAQKARAQHQLSIRCEALSRQLSSMSLLTHRLTDGELMGLVYTCLRPREARSFPLLPSWIEGIDRLITQDLTKRPQANQSENPSEVSPLHIPQVHHSLAGTEMGEEIPIRWPMVADLIAPACIQVKPDYVQIEQDYVQVLDVHTLPRQVGLGWFGQLMRIDEVMDVSLFYIPQPAQATMRALRRKRFEMHSSTMLDREQDRYPDPKRVAAQADIERLMDGIADGRDRVLEFAMHVLIRGVTLQEMQKRTERIRATLYAMQLGSRVAYFEQAKGLRSCLPYARNALRTNEYPLVLGSHEASSTFPFQSHTLFEEDGILEGITHTGSPVVVNWWGKGRRNANRLVVGPSGSGKSFKVHLDIDRLFLRYGKKLCENGPLPFQCIVVDIEREFRRHTLARGGQWIRLAPGTRQCINPFDLPQTHRSQTHQYVEYSLADKIADLQALLDVMLAEHDAAGRGRLSNQEKGLLDKVLYEAYKRCGIADDPTTHDRTPPLMSDLYTLLLSEVCGEDVTGLGSRLHRFVSGSLAGLFSGQTNVDMSAPLECFDIHDLPTDLRPIAIFLLSSHVWNISFGSSVPILFIVDELASLFQYEEGRRFIEALFQRARKHHLSVVGVTQYVGILADSSIPTNSATTILMAQEAASLDKVQQIFHLSEAEVRELRTFGKGEALLLMGAQRFAVRFEASDSEYQIATSDPADLAQLAHENQGENND